MKSSGRFQCWYVLFGGEIPQHMQVFCTKMLLKEGKKKVPHGSRCCSQLPFGVVLTFLQLNHPVIVLKEGIAAECVCKQHLKKKKQHQ